MSMNTRSYIPIIASAFFAVAHIASPVNSQQPGPVPAAERSDTVFNEIRLSPEGVTAIDTSGFNWHYDFDKDEFVQGVKKSESSQEEFLTGGRSDTPPVEQRCTRRIDIVPSTRSVQVGYDEYVEGSINALGRVTIKGWVKGDVQSFRKRVIITETGQVDGDVKAPTIVVKEGGLVRGRTIETGNPFDFEDLGVEFSPNGVVIVASFIAFLLVTGFLAVSLMPKQLSVARSCIEKHKVRTFSLGFLFLMLIPVIVMLLIITILGITLIPFLPLAYLAAFVIGTVSFGGKIGAGLSKLIGGSEGGLMFQSMTGVLLFMSLWMVVAVLLGSTGEVATGLGIAFLVISILISTYPICTGVGACLLTRFGFREYVSWKKRSMRFEVTEDEPAPPPIPNSPNIGNTDRNSGTGK